MKFIDRPSLSQLSRTLTHDSPEVRVRSRIELYSCKPINREKRLFKALEAAYTDELAAVPPAMLPAVLDESSAAFGPIDKATSRKTLYTLVSTLNIAFPDHQFSTVRPEHFRREGSDGATAVLNALSTTLSSSPSKYYPSPRSYSAYPPTSTASFQPSTSSSSSPPTEPPNPFAAHPLQAGTLPELYKLLDDHIRLTECEVYSYSPDIDEDPHAGAVDDDDDSDDDAASDIESEDSDWSDAEFVNEDDEPFDADWDDVTASPTLLPTSTETSPSVSPTVERRTSYPIPINRKRRAVRRSGTLLWSSHWFFYDRKLKRMLYVTVWARTKTRAAAWAASSVPSAERFFAWDGAVGAGARAMGLRAMSF